MGEDKGRGKKGGGAFVLWEPAGGQTVGQLCNEHIYLLWSVLKNQYVLDKTNFTEFPSVWF